MIKLGDIVGIPIECDDSGIIGFEECWDIGVVQGIRLGALSLSSTTITPNIAGKVQILVHGAWHSLDSVRVFDDEEKSFIELNTAEFPIV